MLTTKLIEIAINIHDCVSLCSHEDNLKNIITDRYEGKCIRGCLVIEVQDILKRSDCMITQDGSPDYGIISVVVKVSAIELRAGDIVTGCTVRNRDASGVVICGNNYVSAMLNPHVALESVRIGQIMPVIVGGARYAIGSSKIAVNATPFAYVKNPICYRTTTPTKLSAQAMAMLAPILTIYADEKKKAVECREASPQAYDVFASLLWAYRVKPFTPDGATAVSCAALLKPTPVGHKITYLCRDTRINPADDLVYMYTEQPNIPEYTIVDVLSYENAVAAVTRNVCVTLRTIREMVEIYSTPDLIRAHDNIWRMIAKMKQ